MGSTTRQGAASGQRLDIVIPRDPVRRASPEIRYLRDLLFLRARRVFDRVTTWKDAAEGGADWFLLMGTADAYVAEASLEAMRDRVRASGSMGAYPVRFDEVSGRGEPPQTLRAYERAEARILRRRRLPWRAGRGEPPLALVRAGPFLERFGGRAPEDWYHGTLGLDDLRGIDLVRAGVCYVFIDYYGTMRDDVLELLPEDATEVLEVGCGRGLTGEILQRRRGCRVTGIELNEAAAQEARGRLHRVISGDAERVDLGGPYDAVIAFELFEHLVEPHAFLRRAHAAVRPGGCVLLSVPNVGHHSVVEDLIAGHWDYVPMGLLCYTHLRFFTRSTLVDWLHRAGVRAFRIIPQQTRLPRRFRRLGRRLDLDTESLSTSGFYVVVDKPRHDAEAPAASVP